LLVLGVQTVN